MRKIPRALFVFLFLFSVPALAQEYAHSAAPAPAASPQVHMKLRTIWPMKPGEKVDCYLYLWTDKGPLRLEDMDMMHTKKLHLFLMSPDFRDFYHAHPIATGGEGEFRFSIQPPRKVPLRAWAEFSLNGKRNVVAADLDGKTDKIKPPVAPQVVQAETSDVVFTIHFSTELRAGSVAKGTLYAINKNSRLPYTDLEPILGAFAHIAAFSSDYRSLYHSRPDGPEITDSSAHGGPALKFQLTPEKPGMMKVFAQFRTRGLDLLAPFTVRVSPAMRTTPDRNVEDEEAPIQPPDAAPPEGF